MTMPNRNVVIGVIGKKTLTKEEHEDIFLLGALLARHGRDLVTTKAAGTNAVVVEGYESEGRQARILAGQVFQNADVVFVYANETILKTLEDAGVDLNRAVIKTDHAGLRAFLDLAIATPV